MREASALWIPSPFHWNGREGQVPRFVIIHATAGGTSAQAIAGWFQNPNAQASTNYVIGQDGVVVCCVDENDAPWANGALTAGHDAFWDSINGTNPNLVTISIEHCKPSSDNSDQLTQAQKDASFTLVKSICQRCNIPMHQADASGGIASHASIDPVNRARCPGPYPWDELFAFLNPSPSQPPPLQGADSMKLTIHHISPNPAMLKQAEGVWVANKLITVLHDSGIFQAWAQTLYNGCGLGVPLTAEYQSNDWNNAPIVRQDFAGGHAEWNSTTNTCRLFVAGIGELTFA